MRFVAVKQFQMQVAAGFVREALKKFARKAKPECAGSVLFFLGVGDFLLRKFVQSAPDKMRAATEIQDTSRETFIHWHIRFCTLRCGHHSFPPWLWSKPSIPRMPRLSPSAVAKACPSAMPQSSTV